MIGIKSEALFLFRKFITSKTQHLIIRSLFPRSVFCDSPVQRGKTSLNDNVIKDAELSAPLTRSLKEVCKYFDSTGTRLTNLIHQLPKRVVKQRKTMAPHLYLLDDSVAESIVDLIKDDLLADPQKVVEINAGMGLITEKLLVSGIPSVTVMELHIQFIKVLANLQARYSDRLTIYEADVINIWKMGYQDKQDGGNRLADLFSMFPFVKWGDEVGLRIIGTITKLDFIKHLILDVVRQCGLVSYGRPCLYLSLPPSIWMRLTSDRNAGLDEYRNLSVLFQLFFEYKMLGKLPRKAYLPWISTREKNSKLSEKKKMDQELMYVVKIEGRKNLFTEIIDGKQIQPLWYFVNHHMIARSNRVIPHMEGWQPGCGPSLIMRDFNIFTQFGDLSPQQVLELFKEFATWEGYLSSFLPSMENSPQKMEQLLF